MAWQVAAVANLIVAVAYLAISAAIARPLIRTGQLWANKLGTATAAIFLTCAVHHGMHGVHMTLPVLGILEHSGHALRTAFGWHQAGWDILTASVGVWYWSLRRLYAPLMRGAQLFEDLKERQRQALEINDNIVQGLTVAQMALALDERKESKQALESTLVSARRIISDLLGEVDSPETRLGPGDLVRSAPAVVHPDPSRME